MKESYKVTLTWYYNTLDEENTPVSRTRTEEVELWHLNRTVVSHSKLAMKLLLPPSDQREMGDLAMEFAKTLIVDEKLRDEIAKDMFACIDLFLKDECQQDLADFFETAGFLKQRLQEPQSKK